MTTRLARLAFALCMAVSAAALGADSKPGLKGIGDRIRAGQAEVGTDYSMDAKRGRFHIIHSKELGMRCAACHQGKTYVDDYISVRREGPRKGPGRYINNSCTGCHAKGGPATRFYGTAGR